MWYCIDQRLPLLLAKGLVKLIVVDSLAALFRSEFEPGEMFSRAKQLQRFGGKLHYLSSQHNVPVICVNQVSGGLETAGGVRIAHFNMATWGVAGAKATINSVRSAVLFENEVHLKLYKEGCKAAP